MAKRLPLWAIERAKKLKDGWFTPLGKVRRILSLGRIVSMFKNEDATYVSFVIDDSTGTIRIKCFGELAGKAQELDVGDLVKVMGTLREFGGEVYVACEELKKVENIGEELLWMLRMWKLRTNLENIKKSLKEVLKEVGTLPEALVTDEWEIPKDVVEELIEEGEVYRPEEGKLSPVGGVTREVEGMGEEMAEDLGGE